MNFFLYYVKIHLKDGGIMARKARIKDDYGVFYIHQQSTEIRQLFECDADRDKFLQILNKAQIKFHFKLYAYCILSNNEYHLVLDVNGGDLSKIMKSINIAYALYIKCNNKLFKDRYKSILLKTEVELTNSIVEIHNRNHLNSPYNNYSTTNSFTTIPVDLISSNMFTNKECYSCLKSLKEARVKLNEIADKKNLTIADLINDKKQRNTLIKEFRRHSTLSLKDLGILFGDLSESSICKIINQ